ncbi:aminoglycoside phosphotransferase family protein [Tessaracoccus flavus]|uniref:Aminoglycoside phosphotransferase domain-containing protein n=1 Tax=Tessaracoccus flavus TaxID=1610493 RepID=A0A1Q2CDD6_9ACTN|nr:phosphotransferase [Tessaracoccus flavus]AQP44065.1 hypothetical protein RPIT_03905 [Tessaracoccus flavus]SDY33699.1 Ser/Thr protein kinase RdoA involved in Cpx stress response, MazF antagonist [Tessaracoccus flavus]
MRQLVDALLDPVILAELTGRTVVADRIRIKAKNSVVLALRDAETGQPDGWARVLWPITQDKASKVVERAQRRGQRIQTRPLHAGLMMQWGELASDPQLAAVYRVALKEGLIEAGDQVLRYNPLRRLVVRHGDTTVRLSTQANPVALPLDWALIEDGVPLPGRLDSGAHPQIAVQRFVGDTDLEDTRDLAATRTVGAALATLHRAEVPNALRGWLSSREPDPREQGAAHVELLSLLDDDLAARMASLADQTARRWDQVRTDTRLVVHGDASPDQMLLDSATGRVWVTDLERACLADPAVDLGSYLANCSDDEGAALLAGYTAAGGALPASRLLDAARSRAILLAAADPIRRAEPEWREHVSQRLDALEGTLR